VRKESAANYAIFLTIVAVLLTSCVSLKVPLQPPNFRAGEYLQADSHGLNLSVKPIEGINDYWKLFDDDLPAIGIAAVWVVVKNSSDGIIDLAPSSWSIQIGERNYARIENSAALSRYYKGRKTRIYALNAERRAWLDLERVTFHPGRMRQATEADGFVFFGIDPSLALLWTRGARLWIRDVRINNGKRFNLSLPLAYASP